MEHVVPSRELVQTINRELPIEPLDPNYEGEVAERWRYKDGSGEIGFISSVTQAFCRSCTRARLSAEGQLYTCLFATHGHGLPLAHPRWSVRRGDLRAHRPGLVGPRRPLLRNPHRRDGEDAQGGDVVYRRLALR